MCSPLKPQTLSLKNLFPLTERDFTPGKKITKCLISFTAISQINTHTKKKKKRQCQRMYTVFKFYHDTCSAEHRQLMYCTKSYAADKQECKAHHGKNLCVMIRLHVKCSLRPSTCARSAFNKQVFGILGSMDYNQALLHIFSSNQRNI